MDGSRIRATGCLVLLGAFLAFGTASSAYALLDPVNTEWHSTARALAMGNAGLATAEDPSTAMFYNPAALADGKKFRFELLSPQFEFSTSNLDVAGGANFGKLIGLNSTLPLLRANKGAPVQLGFSIYPNFSAKNFAFGILASGEGGSYVSRQGDLVVRSQYLIVPTIGLSVGMLAGILKIGVAARAVQVTTQKKTYLAPSLDTQTFGYRKDAEEGMGFGVDVGTLITLPFAALPTFAVVGRNLGDTSLSKGASYGVATGSPVGASSVPMMIDTAFAIQPKLGQTTILKFATEVRDVQDASRASTGRKINVGFELGFSRRVYLRWGGSQGYWSAGVGLGGKSATLDLTTYGEELHPTKFRRMEDRRVVFRYGGKF